MNAIKKIPAWLGYTILFAVITSTFAFMFSLTNTSLIWSFDGIAQHYPILVSFHDLLVNFIHHPSQGLTHWSWEIGLGADQLTSFSYYVVGDLFNYLIVFFPKSQIEQGYGFLVLLRLYCAGLAFILYAKQFNFKKYSLVISALTYTFGSYALYAGLHHAFFILPLIFFPLLALGIEKIIHNQSPLWLLLATLITFLSNFYFAYILGLGCMIYVIIRYFSVRKAPWFHCKASLLKLIGAILGGIGLSSVLFVPTMLYAFKSTRIKNVFANGYLTYPTSYYLNLPGKILGLGGAFNFWLLIGISGFSFLAVVYTFSHFKKYAALKWGLIVALIGILLPAFSSVFNAFASPSNRWTSLILLPIGLATAVLADQITSLTKRDLMIFALSSLSLISLIWLGNGFIFKVRRHDFSEYFLLFVLLGILFAAQLFHWKPQIIIGSVLALVTLNLISLGIGFYSPDSSGYAKGMLNQKMAAEYTNNYYDGANQYVKPKLKTYRTTIGPKYHYFPDDRDSFINTDFFNAASNLPMILGTHDIASYLTVENGYVGKLERLVQNNQFTQNAPVAQNDYRSSLENLFGVKYMFLRSDKAEKSLPFGFKLVRDRQQHPKLFQNGSQVASDPNALGTVLAKNQNALPLLYTQTKLITNHTFNQLSANDKEQALIQAANLSKPVKGLQQLNYHSQTKRLKYAVNFDTTDLLTTQAQLDQSDFAKKTNQLASPNVYYASSDKIAAILKQNQKIETDLKTKNQTGLHYLTRDALGKAIPTSLTIDQPQKTKHAELYLELDGIQADYDNDDQINAIKSNRNALNNQAETKFDQLNYFRKNISTYNNGSFVLTAATKGMTNAVTQLGTDELSNYLPKKQALINLGYSTKERKQITLKYTGVNSLHFKRARIIAVPFDKNYEAQIKQVQANGLTHIKQDHNQVTGISHNAHKSVLTTSIPYSSGWKIMIDGKPAPTKVVNQAFVGGIIPAGTHHIKLTYQTPGLLIGKMISLVSLLIVLSISGMTWYLKKIKK
ncbi:YfhO family protein [Fructilactobacillus frigidiflavus]|uniref:YfhO family protein n=1 Tax=Fructilactobacillus frigidiflavus TaxID=3242688 RepID=UPI003757F420